MVKKKPKRRRPTATTSSVRVPPKPERQKLGRNQLCPCGSGLKYKKCCNGQLTPKPPTVPLPQQFPREATTNALLSARVSPEYVWAYYQTGVYITDVTRHLHSSAVLSQWDDEAAEYRNSPSTKQESMLSKALGGPVSKREANDEANSVSDQPAPSAGESA